MPLTHCNLLQVGRYGIVGRIKQRSCFFSGNDYDRLISYQTHNNSPHHLKMVKLWQSLIILWARQTNWESWESSNGYFIALKLRGQYIRVKPASYQTHNNRPHHLNMVKLWQCLIILWANWESWEASDCYFVTLWSCGGSTFDVSEGKPEILRNDSHQDKQGGWVYSLAQWYNDRSHL